MSIACDRRRNRADLDIDEVLEEICLAKKIGVTLDCVGYLGGGQYHDAMTNESGRAIRR